MTGLGCMDELAAVAAVLAMSIDDFAEEDLEQRPPCGVTAGSDAATSIDMSIEQDMENFLVDAAQCGVGAGDPEVSNSPTLQLHPPCAHNHTQPDCHCSRVCVAALRGCAAADGQRDVPRGPGQA